MKTLKNQREWNEIKDEVTKWNMNIYGIDPRWVMVLTEYKSKHKDFKYFKEVKETFWIGLLMWAYKAY